MSQPFLSPQARSRNVGSIVCACLQAAACHPIISLGNEISGTQTSGVSSSSMTSSAADSSMSSSTSANSSSTTSTTSTTSLGKPELPQGGEVDRKVAFITDSPYNGNLGGLDGADSICQEAAQAAGLAGTYRAWLSDETGSPSTRFTQAAVPYVRLDGKLIAINWADLVDTALNNPINITEKGGKPPGNVFTNTRPDGTVWNAKDCINWTDEAATVPGNGFPNSANNKWTQAALSSNCFDLLHIYCFEQ